MNIPKRMSVRSSADRIRREWLTGLCVFDALLGLALTFGPSDSVAQMLLRGAHAPPPLWGGLILAGAGLIWFGWSVPGAMGAGLGFLAQCTATLWTIGAGTAASYIGPILFGWAAYQHMLIIHEVGSGIDADRERRQRGR